MDKKLVKPNQKMKEEEFWFLPGFPSKVLYPTVFV